jgi:hypothetical protein
MRLPALKDLSSRQQEISDRITARRGATRGPFLVWLRSPELCERVEALGAYCRFESGLDPRIRGSADPRAEPAHRGRCFDAQYSWNAHLGGHRAARQRSRLAAGEAAYVRSLTAVPVKVTLIAPGFLADRFWQDGVTDQVYASHEELAAEVAAITRA